MSTISIFTVLLIVLLLAITIVDMQQLRIPNVLCVLLFIGALGYWLIADYNRIILQIASGATIGCILWLLRYIHARFTGRVGLGMGDVKMSAAGAVWLSPFSLPLFIFSASFTALTFMVIQVLINKELMRGRRIAFGPFLSVGLLACWVMENYI